MSKTPEGYVLDALCSYLEAKGYVFWRSNNTPVYDAGQQRFRAMSRYAIKGVSDIIILCNGKAYFCEAKSATGVLSADQKNFRELVTMAGSEYFVARSIDDLIDKGF